MSGPDQLTPESRYANYFEIGHNAAEFILAFGQHYAAETPRVHNRIVTSPMYIKRLFQTLRKSIEEYEQTYGVIADWDESGLGVTGGSEHVI